jgi:hypothetical protein
MDTILKEDQSKLVKIDLMISECEKNGDMILFLIFKSIYTFNGN